MQGAESRWRGGDPVREVCSRKWRLTQDWKEEEYKIADVYQVIIMSQVQILVLYMNYL